MADYPYTYTIGKLEEFLRKIPAIGVPPTVTGKWLEGVGLKSEHEQRIIRVLRGIGFIDAQGKPTDRWKAFRNRDQAGAVMASALRGAYSDLFAIYPDAHMRDDNELRDYFRAHSEAGDRAVQAMVATFKTLARFANFDDAPADEFDSADASQSVAISSSTITKPSTRTTSQSPIVINVNIQIAVPESEKPEVYDRFFEALRRHILS